MLALPHITQGGRMSYLAHSTLDGMPNTSRDQYGNLNLDSRAPGAGLRPLIEYGLTVPTDALAGRRLGDLLEWMRWGCNSGVMWEAGVSEILIIIERWESANPGAGLGLYTDHDPSGLTWDELWSRAALHFGWPFEFQVRRGFRCPYDQTIWEHTSLYKDRCPKCNSYWLDNESVEIGPRGVGTYNTYLHGADGDCVALAAYNSRNWIRLSKRPTSIEQMLLNLKFAQGKIPA